MKDMLCWGWSILTWAEIAHLSGCIVMWKDLDWLITMLGTFRWNFRESSACCTLISTVALSWEALLTLVSEWLSRKVNAGLCLSKGFGLSITTHKDHKLSWALYFGLLPWKVSIVREAVTVTDTDEGGPGMGWEEVMGSWWRRHCMALGCLVRSNSGHKYSIRMLGNLSHMSLESGGRRWLSAQVGSAWMASVEW